jgi:hypothetical protein
MKELEKEFIGKGEVRGFQFEQVQANDNGYIYKVQHIGEPYYEVFKRKENTQFDNISYPSSKAFGVWAWWYSSLEKAMTKFNEL